LKAFVGFLKRHDLAFALGQVALQVDLRVFKGGL
jgi:hypothetical protein